MAKNSLLAPFFGHTTKRYFNVKISDLFSLRSTALVCSIAVLAWSCSGTTEKPKGPDTIPGTGAQGLKVGKQTFMMPSPVQIAELVKNSGANYDKAMLHSTDNAKNYTDQMKQALNLGVYGADLGYVTMYDQTNDALSYFTTVQRLGDQLKLTSAFDKSLMDRFNNNNGKKDSIIPLVMEAFRKSDDFLKGSDRERQAALILCGGWVESIHFALSVYQKSPSEDVKKRIGEQKNTVAGLYKLIGEVGKENDSTSTMKAEFQPLYQKLVDLNNVYNNISLAYVFAEPKTDAANHMTEINGTSTVEGLDDARLKELIEKVNAIRDFITN